MIVTVVNNKEGETETYSFTQQLVSLGRNPSAEPSLQIESETVSRTHLRVKVVKNSIQIMDLNSSRPHLT